MEPPPEIGVRGRVGWSWAGIDAQEVRQEGSVEGSAVPGIVGEGAHKRGGVLRGVGDGSGQGAQAPGPELEHGPVYAAG